jgi:hypothetical protein
VHSDRFALTDAELARKPGPIYFWANLGNPVSSPVHGFPNPFVIRPSELVIFEDGQWVIEKLHWTGWGTSVARAKGKSNSDDDVPNVAEGKRIITWAKVTLSKPGEFHGRRVYRCIRIKVPRPAHYGPACLQRVGRSVILSPPGSGTPVGGGGSGGPRHLSDFFSPDRKVWCGIDNLIGQASCGTYPKPPTHSATVDKTGHVEICSVEKVEYPEGSHGPPLGCYQNWPAERLPVLRFGEETVAAGFRCRSEPDGITCIKTSGAGKGKGFRVNKEEAVEVST